MKLRGKYHEKIIVASLTLAFASAAQSAVLLEKIVERSYSNGMSTGNPSVPKQMLKKTCLIQNNRKMVVKYEVGDLISTVTYPIQIDKVLIPKKIAAVISEVQVNGKSSAPSAMSYLSTENSMPGQYETTAIYNAYNKKIQVPLLNVKDGMMGLVAADAYKANSETATNLKNFIDLTCENLPTVTESPMVK